MAGRRRSTVHDFASLRLHPDGSRVRSGVSSQGGWCFSSTAVAKRQSARPVRRVVRNAQGNSIARDAGGSDFVKQRRNVKLKDLEGWDQASAEGLAEQTDDDADTFTGSGEKSQPERRMRRTTDAGEDEISSDDMDAVKDRRAKKRKKFYRDFLFPSELQTEEPGFVTSERASISDNVSLSEHIKSRSSHSQLALPVPSSDLLKCIHHFASEYYTERGCLFNAPKRAREASKLAKLRKGIARKATQRDFGESELGCESSEGGSNGRRRSSEMVGDRAGRIQKEGGTEQQTIELRKQRKESQHERPRRDMYKAFDGSALLAFGMLLQEHAAEVLNAGVPEYWLQQTEALDMHGEGGVRGEKNSQRGKKVEGGISDGSDAEEHDGPQRAEEAQETSESDNNHDSTPFGGSSMNRSGGRPILREVTDLLI